MPPPLLHSSLQSEILATTGEDGTEWRGDFLNAVSSHSTDLTSVLRFNPALVTSGGAAQVA